MLWLYRILITVLLLSSLLWGQPSEAEVKAAFLLNFARFVEWPANGDATPDTPFSVCILRDEKFRDAAQRVMGGETVNKRPLSVKLIDGQASQCEVVYFPANARGFQSSHFGPGVLTVGESPDFLKEGGMIAFVIENRRVRFDVNLRAAGQAGLSISSRLLGVARRVEQ